MSSKYPKDEERTVSEWFDCFDSEVAANWQPAIGIAWRKLGRKVDAEDCVQNATISAYNSLQKKVRDGEGDSLMRFRRWFFAIVTNEAKNILRKRGPGGGTILPPGEDYYGYSNGIKTLEAQRDLKAALPYIRTEEAKTLDMFFLQGMLPRDIAATLRVDQKLVERWIEFQSAVKQEPTSRAIFEKSLGKLTEEQTQIIQKLNIDGMTFSQVATEFNCSVGTAHGIYKKAVERLRRLYAQ